MENTLEITYMLNEDLDFQIFDQPLNFFERFIESEYIINVFDSGLSLTLVQG